MTNYKRLISYMYEYENGIKRKNVGYVRIEVKNGQCKFTIHMQLPGQPDSVFPTYMIHRDSSGLDLVYLGDSLLKANMMDSRFIADEADVMDSGYNLKEMSGILIFMNNNIFFATLWDDYVLRPEELLQAMKSDKQKEIKNKNERKIPDRQPAEINAEPDRKEDYAGEEKKSVGDIGVQNKQYDIMSADKPSDSKTAVKSHDRTKAADDLSKDKEAANKSHDGIKTADDLSKYKTAVKPHDEMKASNDLNKDEAAAGRADERIQEDKNSKEVLHESGQNQNKTYEAMQRADGKKEDKAECENIEKENREEGYYEEKLSLEEELKIPTYKFPRGLKTVEMFRRSMVMADKIYGADKNDKASENIGDRQQAESGMKTVKDGLTEVSRPVVKDNKDLNARDSKELKAADAGPARIIDSRTADMDSVMARFNRLYPFEDNEIIMCVKIEPKDIGLLPKEYWPLSSNSFLLHGYYCYHHLILAKMKYRDKAVYILGVPGLFQHKEQFMARMFGFDCFKSIKKREPKKGDFGYWYLQLNC